MLQRLPYRRLGIGLGLAVSFGLTMAFGRWFYQHEQWQFLASLHPGMKVANLVAEHGPPDAVLKPGEELIGWGGYPGRRVAKTTYVYLMGPGNIHRIAITIEDDAVVDFELNRT